MEKHSSFNSFTLKHILCFKSIKTLIQVHTYYIYTYIYILYMDETYFNVVYFFKYLVDLQGNSDTIKFCSESLF